MMSRSSRDDDAAAARTKDLQPTLEPLAPIDRAIVDVLRRDARTPNNAIAAEVGIAPSTCLTRIRRLERIGAIRGYHADVDLHALATPLQAMISVRLRAGARHRLRAFTEQTRGRPEVLNVFFVAGTDDFLIHVAMPDAGRLRDFVEDHLSANIEVAATHTQLIFEHVRGAGWPAQGTIAST